MILTIAVLGGQLVSVEQPAGSCLYHLHCYKVLARLGCVLTRFCFCSFGSPFFKRSVWLHNKPWVTQLAGGCSCPSDGKHFSVRGAAFSAESIRDFCARCRPDCASVYGAPPKVGQAVADFLGLYPLGLVRRLACGSLAAKQGHVGSISQSDRDATARTLDLPQSAAFSLGVGDSDLFEDRPWHEDPEWISEICKSLRFKLKFKYHFSKPGHINVNEARVFKSWLKSLAKDSCSVRAVALLDSRVTIGATAKGRSSSFAISRVLGTSLGYIIGSSLFPGLLHCYSSDNTADGPSRDGDVPSPSREKPLWLSDLLQGDVRRFDAVVESSGIKKLPGRWLRFLLLLGGDIERNPGPAGPRVPRGVLGLEAGFVSSTVHKMRKARAALDEWIISELRAEPESVFADNRSAELALRGFGLYLFSSGLPRYLLVYALTSIQNEFPSYRNNLSAAWQVDHKWQLVEPGQCRAVLPTAAFRACLSLAALWGWKAWMGLVLIGFLAMLHPSEMLGLCRRDLMFPGDCFGHVRSLFVHLRSPKTARFARRQHGRIDDDFAIRVIFSVFGALPLNTPLYPASAHTFRRQWNAVMAKLGIPHKAATRGATPGVLRGSGATHFYLQCENIPLLSWRGRWSRQRTLEHYLQEVAAQMMLGELHSSDRLRIATLDSACEAVLQAVCLEPDFSCRAVS